MGGDEATVTPHAPGRTMAGPRSLRVWIPVLLSCLLLSWFLPGWLDAGFGWDDRQLLFENPAIRDFSIGSIFSEGFWSFRGNGEMYRPLTALSLAFDHQLFGEDPLGYHRVNLLLHLLACLLLTLGILGPKSRWALPFFLVLYLHPSSAEQAIWIAGRVGSLMLCWGGLAMLAARRRAWILSACLVFVAGLCRDDGILFFVLVPLVLPVRLAEYARRAVPFLLLWLAVRFFVLGGEALPLDPETSRGLLQRLGDVLTSFGFTTEVVLLFERPRLMQSGLPDAGWAVVALPLFLVWMGVCRTKGWWGSLRAACAVLLVFVPFSGFVRLGEPVGGRYAYALVPWTLAMILLVPAVRRLRPLWFVPTALLLLPLWFREASVLARAETTYARVLEYEPKSRRARLNLALEWERLGQQTRALSQFEELMRQHPRYAKPFVNRGRLLYQMGEKQRGLAALDRATRDFPRSSRGWLTYGRFLYREHRYEEAAHAMEKCLSVRPSETQALLFLCRARLRQGDVDRARKAYEDLRRIAPRHPALESLRREMLR